MKVEDELVLFNKQWDEAMVKNNAEEISRFISDDWVIIGTEGGITTKKSFLDVITSGDLTHNRMDSDESRIKIYGETAVVTNRGTSAGLYKGVPFEFYEWSTSVFVRKNGKWICVLTMLTP